MTVRVGIVGGGQLGYFLCAAARRLGVTTTVLSPRAECPAARAADRVLVGELDDPAAAAALLEASDVVTFEIETIAPEVLRYLGEQARAGHVRVAPGAEVMLTLQNKALQKHWLVRQGLPTAAFMHLPDGPADTGLLIERFGLPLVQKTTVGGFDGRGVQILEDRASLERLWPTPSIIEAWVPAVAEVAVLVARGLDGELRSYEPMLLRMEPACHALGSVVCPASISADTARAATRLAMDVVTALEGVGLFAVEMFVAADEQVLVNEISPRVHNAGHLTIEACETSQFAQHLRAVLGLPLGSTRQRVPVAVMKNLLYGVCFETLGAVDGFDSMNLSSGTAVHWYGKRGPRRYRKMGHVTALGSSVSGAERRAEAAARALSAIGAEAFS